MSISLPGQFNYVHRSRKRKEELCQKQGETVSADESESDDVVAAILFT